MDLVKAPFVEAARTHHGELQITFKRPVRSSNLVVTVNSRDEHGVPPQTHTFELDGAPQLILATGIPLHSTLHYDIFISTVTDGRPSASTLIEISPSTLVGSKPGVIFGEDIAQ